MPTFTQRPVHHLAESRGRATLWSRPRLHAWVAGRVKMDTFPTESRGPSRPSLSASCANRLGPRAHSGERSVPTALPNGVRVGTAVHSDVSPPLRDIQPRPPIPACSAQAGYTFVPTGGGWDEYRVQMAITWCCTATWLRPRRCRNPGELGRPYMVDRMNVRWQQPGNHFRETAL